MCAFHQLRLIRLSPWSPVAAPATTPARANALGAAWPVSSSTNLGQIYHLLGLGAVCSWDQQLSPDSSSCHLRRIRRLPQLTGLEREISWRLTYPVIWRLARGTAPEPMAYSRLFSFAYLSRDDRLAFRYSSRLKYSFCDDRLARLLATWRSRLLVHSIHSVIERMILHLGPGAGQGVGMGRYVYPRYPLHKSL